jgi:fructokinase
MTVMPERIILGGGVMQQEHLFPLIHKHFISISKGYCGYGESLQQVSDLIVSSILQPDAGIIGALVLAQNTFHHNSAKTNLDS